MLSRYRMHRLIAAAVLMWWAPSGAPAQQSQVQVAYDTPTNAQLQPIYQRLKQRAVLEEILPRYVEMQVYEAILENAASQQSAQMVAMRNATDAASDIVQQLTLLRNKVRQEQITKELLDIIGGVEVLAK